MVVEIDDIKEPLYFTQCKRKCCFHLFIDQLLERGFGSCWC